MNITPHPSLFNLFNLFTHALQLKRLGREEARDEGIGGIVAEGRDHVPGKADGDEAEVFVGTSHLLGEKRGDGERGGRERGDRERRKREKTEKREESKRKASRKRERRERGKRKERTVR